MASNQGEEVPLKSWPERLFVALARILHCLAPSTYLPRRFCGYKPLDIYVALFTIALTALLIFWKEAGRFAFVCALYRAYDIFQYRFHFIFVKSKTEPWDPNNIRHHLGYAFVNLYEIVAAYAILYLSLEAVCHGNPPQSMNQFVTAFYYSLVTMMTVGYGDYTPCDWSGQIIVIAQLATSFFLLAFIIPGLVSLFTAKK